MDVITMYEVKGADHGDEVSLDCTLLQLWNFFYHLSADCYIFTSHSFTVLVESHSPTGEFSSLRIK